MVVVLQIRVTFYWLEAGTVLIRITVSKELVQLNNEKHKQPNEKMGQGPIKTLLPTRPTSGQQMYEKMLSFTSC